MKHRESSTRRNLFTLLPVLVLLFASMPVGAASATSGYMPISGDTVLTEDHYGNIEIVANSVTLDCAGHAVTGSGTGDGIVLSGRTGVTVRNCDVSGFVQGIMLWDSDDNTIEKNTVHDNVSGDFSVGIGIHGLSNDNSISKNLATGNGEDGIHVGESEGNTLIQNSAIGNGRTGIIFNYADNNIATENVASNNKSNGFWVGNSTGNTFERNETHDNTHVGIRIQDSDDTRVVDNFSTGNMDGIGLTGNGNWVEGNTVLDNDDRGIFGWVLEDSHFVRNHAGGSGSFGFWLGGSSNGNTVYRNEATSSGVTGFEVENSEDNTLDRNRSWANLHSGFSISGFSTGNLLTHNKSEFNEVNGFFVVDLDSVGNSLVKNEARRNGGHGIEDWTMLGTGTSGTGNDYSHNVCVGIDQGDSSPEGLCLPNKSTKARGLAFSPVEWTILLDDPDYGPGIHTIFTIADVRPLTVDEVEDLSGRLVWKKKNTTVDLCNIEVREVGDGYLHIGDGYQTTEGCGSNPTAMQDAFDDFGLPKHACVAVTVGGRTHEHCAPLNVITSA